jgi:hypothetical protein
MVRVTQPAVKAWTEATKMGNAAGVVTLDTELLDQLEDETLSRLQGAGYETSTWTDSSTTPRIVRLAIAKLYVSWLIDRQYSEDEDLNAYAQRLAANAETVIAGLVDGTLVIPGSPEGEGIGQPSFYPNDDSSAACPTWDDRSLGPAQFSMGQVF